MSQPTDCINQIFRENVQRKQLEGLRRSLFRANTASSNQTSLIDFCSNNYLGLAKQTYTVSEIESGSGSSRIVLQSDFLIDDLESQCAKFFRWPTGVFLPNGFMANLAIFDVLASLNSQKNDSISDVEVFLDLRAHASLHLGKKTSGVLTQYFRHHDYAQLNNLLKKSQSKIKIILVESLHSMDGTFESANELVLLCKNNNALIVVDEAHTAGICGENGSGWIQNWPDLLPYVLCVMYGFGKALGVSGGFIGCSYELREQLMQCAKSFLYSTAQSPVLTHIALNAVREITTENSHLLRASLQGNIDQFRNILKLNGWSVGNRFRTGEILNDVQSPIFAVGLGNSDRAVAWEKQLFAQNFMVRAIRPPTVPRDTARLRIIVHAQSDEQEMNLLVEALSQLRDQKI